MRSAGVVGSVRGQFVLPSLDHPLEESNLNAAKHERGSVSAQNALSPIISPPLRIARRLQMPRWRPEPYAAQTRACTDGDAGLWVTWPRIDCVLDEVRRTVSKQGIYTVRVHARAGLQPRSFCVECHFLVSIGRRKRRAFVINRFSFLHAAAVPIHRCSQFKRTGSRNFGKERKHGKDPEQVTTSSASESGSMGGVSLSETMDAGHGDTADGQLSGLPGFPDEAGPPGGAVHDATTQPALDTSQSLVSACGGQDVHASNSPAPPSRRRCRPAEVGPGGDPKFTRNGPTSANVGKSMNVGGYTGYQLVQENASWLGPLGMLPAGFNGGEASTPGGNQGNAQSISTTLSFSSPGVTRAIGEVELRRAQRASECVAAFGIRKLTRSHFVLVICQIPDHLRLCRLLSRTGGRAYQQRVYVIIPPLLLCNDHAVVTT